MKGKHGDKAVRRRTVIAEAKAADFSAEARRLREALEVAHDRLEAEAQRLAKDWVEALRQAHAAELQRLKVEHASELQRQLNLRLEFGRLIARGHPIEPEFAPEVMARLTALAGDFVTLADVLNVPVETNRSIRRAGARAVRRTLVARPAVETA